MKYWKKNYKSSSIYFPRQQSNYLFLSKKNTSFIKNGSNLVESKSRICSHLSPTDKTHEMLIFHKKDAYVRPHKHMNKLQSFHLISGKISMIFFNSYGSPIKVVKMGEYSSGKAFYYKLFKQYWHTMLIDSDAFFHEVTNGPYKKNGTLYAEWSPAENNKMHVKKYLIKLRNVIKELQ